MKRVAVTVTLLLAFAIVGVALSRTGREPDTRAHGSGPAGDAPAATSPRTDPSPEIAAAAAVATTGEVVTAGLISRRELIESFTTPDFGSELADLTSEQVTSMELSMTETGRDAGHLTVDEIPLRVRTTGRTDATASVEVWSVVVVASADEPVARQMWRTVSLELALVEGRWLVDGWRSTEGPSPAAAPEGAIASGAEVVSVLAWGEVS